MKRNILAVVIPTLLAAGAVNAAEVYNKDGNKVDIYGRVTALHYFSDNNGNDGDKTYARLGFKGESQITSDLTGFGRFEYEFKGNRAEGSQGGDKTRLAFAGLKFADYGSVDFGRNYGVVYDALGWTDVLPEFGGDTTGPDSFMNGRTTGVATYRNTNFFGLVDGWNFAVQYQGKNSDDSNNPRSLAESNGDGWGISSSYESEIGLGVVGTYAASDRTDEQNANAAGRGAKAEAWATAVKYDANNIYLAATYGEYRNLSYIDADFVGFADKTKVFEAVAQYQFDFGLRPSLAYVSSKGKVDSTNQNDYLNKYVSVGATYAFNKNVSTYVDYQINLIKDDNAYGINDDDTVALGLTYQF
ncbi:porin [Affinibrenneria salicis]|uniref:Porin n=2 Tax=Affinibrenneria salicis TaxID=2590031 RepID=A0A5J5G405_9GAMM|nr:porin [Affinibrenneria salicis]